MINTALICVASTIAVLLTVALAPSIWREWRERNSPVGRALRGKSDPMMQAHGDWPHQRGFR